MAHVTRSATWLLLFCIACSESSPGSGASSAGSGATAGGGSGGTAQGGNATSGAGAANGGSSAGTDTSGNQTGGASAAGTAGSAGMGGASAGAGGAAGTPMVPDFPPDATFPYVITNYDEPYRGQVHFSAPMGWLNDANGMWFEGGLYHLSYQAFPYSIDEGPKNWGHASSPDLVHWTHWPVMLDPDVNVPGDAWSGSTVVDEANSSGFKQGDGPVLVTLYTCTKKGTCVAYSNDHGITWKGYDQNPVAIGGPNADTRDPHVFWHEPSKKWVCALFENGISFYTSSDLKHWSKVSHVDFGFECPDIYELPLDGDASKTKWVLQDASGAYLLGSFDGTTYTPDSLSAQHLDTSGVFYAAQTFYRKTFPDDRVVQMPWLRGMMGATAPFNQTIGFPLQVQLKTFPNGVRVARTPVDEIKKLYASSQHFAAQTIAQGTNPFAAASSKVFDLEVDVDLAKTAAKSLTLGLGDQNVTLDLAGQKMFDTTVSPINGHIKLRALRDWGQFEIFVNDGQVVHTDVHPFDPANASISLTGDGTISLASADLHQLSRAWPGRAAKTSTILDDNDGSTTYAGAWNLTNEGRYFKNSAHFNTTGTSFELSFTGTRIEWYGLKNTDLGLADVYLDSALVKQDIDCYDPRRQNALLFTQGNLPNGAHTLKVVVSGKKNAASSGTALVHDYVIAYVD